MSMPRPFKLPADIPSWPPGKEFGTGRITLGEIEVCQVSTLEKIWSCTGGNNKEGVAFYKPLEIPPGYFTVGHYTQSNNTEYLEGRLLVVKDNENILPASGSSIPPLAKPEDYSLVWSSESWKGKKDGDGFFWIPTPPQGYTAMGYLVTNNAEKPSLEQVRCVRSDLTGVCKIDSNIWNTASTEDDSFFQLWSTIPDSEKQENSVSAGTFYCTTSSKTENSVPVACLRNLNSTLSGMPNLNQVNFLMDKYGPRIFLHPKEIYFPSSVAWFFKNGALLYKKSAATTPEAIAEDGSNLPQGGSADGEYWIDLPEDEEKAKKLKHGDLQSAEAYANVKAIFGGTFTDIALWLFYPFNGQATLVLLGSLSIPLGRIGEHVGDWEHVTLRVNNFTGELSQLYLSQHSGGRWVKAWDLEYIDGSNKAVVYSARYGHPNFSGAGRVLQGNSKLGVGITNESARSNFYVESSKNYKVVAAEYLKLAGSSESIAEPAWLNYGRKWGPKIKYASPKVLGLVKLPSELSGEDGPTGPKWKSSWYGDEKEKDVF